MANFVLTSAGVLISEYEITDAAGSLSLDAEVDVVDFTTFGGSGWRAHKPGLLSATFGVDGFTDLGANLSDEALFSKMGLGDQVVTLVPNGLTEGNVAYFAKMVAGEYSPVSNGVGDAMQFSLGGRATDAMSRGTLLHYGQETNTHTGAGYQLGAASTGIRAALHVLSGSGTFDVTIESDDNSGFTTPTTRISFTQVGTGTARSFEYASATGAVTDDYWRMVATFTGTRSWAVSLSVY